MSHGVDRWDPFHDVAELQSEMNRLFGSVFGRHDLAQGPERVWAPAVDVYETKDDLMVKAELPGMNEKEVHVSITGDLLTIRGERQRGGEVSEESYYRGERWYGRFERTLPLPVPVQQDKVKAAFRDGVLTITLPKTEELKPKEITISVL